MNRDEMGKKIINARIAADDYGQDKLLTQIDWREAIRSYTARRLMKEFRADMLNIAEVAIAAINAYDKGWACRDN